MHSNILRPIPTIHLPVNVSFSIFDKRLRSVSLSTSLQRRDPQSVFIAPDPSNESSANTPHIRHACYIHRQPHRSQVILAYTVR